MNRPVLHPARWLALAALLVAGGCDRDGESKAPSPPDSRAVPARTPASAGVAAAAASKELAAAVRVETVAVPGDLPAFVLRGVRGPRRMVFLQGACSHGLGYVQSFQHAAASHGMVVAVQADKACDKPALRRWTNTPEVLDRRIEAAFRAAGVEGALRGLAVLGYSSGAVLAEMLAHAQPDRYSHVVLIGGPQKPVEWRLRRTRSTVMIAGEKDRQDLMRRGAKELSAAGIPSKFLILPGAKHGQMGPEAERVMGKALTWLWKNTRSP